MEQMYKQCSLSKPMDGGIARMVSWIRSELAIKGFVLDGLEDPETGKKTSGWTVEDVTEPAMEEKYLVRRAHGTDTVFPSLQSKKEKRRKQGNGIA